MFSHWEKEMLKNCDVLVIGSGITGLSTAAEIKEKYPRKKVIVIEKGVLPSGATTKNAGFFCFGSLTEVDSDFHNFGKEAMIENSLSRYRGLQKTFSRLRKYDLGFESCGGYDVLDSSHSFSQKDIKDKINFYNEILSSHFSQQEVYKLEDNKNSFKNTKAIIKNDFEGAIHTGKLFSALLSYVSSLGVIVLTGLELKSFEESEDSVMTEIYHNDKSWAHIETKKLVVCTNAWISKLFPAEDVVPGRGQVIVTKPLSTPLIPGTYHAEEGYFYFRHLPENRVLFGGGRHLFKKAEESYELINTSEVLEAISEKYASVFGEKPDVDYQWSGIMAFGAQKKPIIKQHGERVFIAGRMSGIGLAQGSNVAESIVSMMFNHEIKN